MTTVASLVRLLRLWLVVIMLVTSPLVDAKSKYMDRLPNGANVRESHALGHVNVNGSGALNAFGRHFIYAAREWSTDLCYADSDGDGQTNGQELGDPCCEWVPGDTPRLTDGLSHPGDEFLTANESRWLNITCPNVTMTKLWMATRSSARRSVECRLVQAVTIVVVILGSAVFA